MDVKYALPLALKEMERVPWMRAKCKTYAQYR